MALNPKRNKKCQTCGKLRPKVSKAKHLTVLAEMTYEAYVERNGGEHCWICGKRVEDFASGRKLQRDHEHTTKGFGHARGLLCIPCNRRLPRDATPQWHRRAADYLEKFAMERELPY
jgi:ribosomal protein S26